MSEFGSDHPPSAYAQNVYPQAGYRPPPPPPAPTGLGIAARIFAVLVTLSSVASLALAFPARDSYREAAADGRDSSDVFTAYELVPLIWTLLILIAFVLTCLWLFECRTRVDAFSPHIWQRRSKVWVWLCWVVPVVSLWFPYQVMRDLRRGSHPTKKVSNSLVGWWLGTWLAYTYTDQIASRVLPFGGDIDIEMIDATLIPVQALSTVFALIACALWLRIISDIMRGQAELGRTTMPPPPPHWPSSQPTHWPAH